MLKCPLLRRKIVMEEVHNKMPLAKDAMHAELQREIGQNQFYYIEVGNDFMDPAVFSGQGRYRTNFVRKMRKAQIKYMMNWELQEMEDNKAQREIMGDENFKEFKETKSRKRAFGALMALEDNP